MESRRKSDRKLSKWNSWIFMMRTDHIQNLSNISLTSLTMKMRYRIDGDGVERIGSITMCRLFALTLPRFLYINRFNLVNYIQMVYACHSRRQRRIQFGTNFRCLSVFCVYSLNRRTYQWKSLKIRLNLRSEIHKRVHLVSNEIAWTNINYCSASMVPRVVLKSKWLWNIPFTNRCEWFCK